MAHILFIDDDRDILATLSRAVSFFGHSSVEYDTGRQGIQAAIQHQPDIIITDLSLIDMTGLEVITALRSEPKTAAIPVVVHSAREESQVREEIQTAGATAFLAKPAPLKDLLALIDRVTSTHLPA